MKKRTLMMLLVLLGLGAGLRAADEPLKLTGKMGIGLDSMPGLAVQQIPLASNLVSTPDTVVFRYWINENFSWEGQLAASYSSEPSATTLTSATRAWGLGTAFKWNYARPSETALAQLLVGIDLAQFAQGPDGSGATQTSTTFSLYAGPGFEYFMPFLHAMSVEGSIRLRISSTNVSSDKGSQASQSSSAVNISGNGFTPLNLALHYYF